jgi:hypothetical protein
MVTVDDKPMTMLIGWKAIAGWLGVAASTARKWERTLKLPVYRVGGQVRAKVEELESWEGGKADFGEI